MMKSCPQAVCLLVITVVVCAQAMSEFPICVYYNGSNSHEPALKTDDEAYPDLLDYKSEDGKVLSAVRCKKPSNLCYALWKEDKANNETNFVLIGQGCWESSGSRDCLSNSCVSGKRQSRASSHARFCCCTGRLCNANVSTANDWEEEMQSEQGEQAAFAPVQSPLHPVSQALLAVAAVLVFVGTVVACFVWRSACKNRQSKMVSTSQDSALSTPLVTNSTADIKLIDVIGQGRYGTVWRGLSGSQEVAVKVFPAHYKSYFCNERDLYSLPHMNHANVVALLGYGRNVGETSQVEYRLVLTLAPRGCLQEYLKQNVLDWHLFCKMARGLAKGLAHLHLDIQKGGEFKPCIAHRDVNSRNVLVKEDLSLVLCDLGLAIQISGAHYVCNGEHMHAESASLTDVGTLRYMAPEVLEGAVNLRECEASLKQVDIYALGLVLWELASRTVDLYVNKQPPPYAMPFQAEVGVHPSLEQMQVMVCRHKARPLFPDWSQSQHSLPSAFRLLKETLEDAWDHDAEARLTALCVEERLAELPALWDRHKGLSPNLHVYPNDTHTNKENQTSDNEVKGPSTRTSSFSYPNRAPNSDSSHSSEKIGNLSVPCQPYHALQPHQGRNPCMERNTMVVESVDELSVSGNALVRKSDKHRPKTSSALHTASSSTLPSTAALAHAPPRSALPLPRPVNPIPFVQNAVREAGATAAPVCPKQPNVGPKGNHNSAWVWLGSVLGKSKTRRDDDWSEQQQLCPPLSSPSDAADLYALQGSGNSWTKSNLEHDQATVSTTVPDSLAVPVPYCQTEVRFYETGHRVSVLPSEPMSGDFSKFNYPDSSAMPAAHSGDASLFLTREGPVVGENSETEVGVAKRLPAPAAARSPSLVRRRHGSRRESTGENAVNTRPSSLLVDVPQ